MTGMNMVAAKAPYHPCPLFNLLQDHLERFPTWPTSWTGHKMSAVIPRLIPYPETEFLRVWLDHSKRATWTRRDLPSPHHPLLPSLAYQAERHSLSSASTSSLQSICSVSVLSLEVLELTIRTRCSKRCWVSSGAVLHSPSAELSTPYRLLCNRSRYLKVK